jgi:ribosomal protein S18 acetylase RimI-like enzyme
MTGAGGELHSSASAMPPVLRPAAPSEIAWVQQRLHEAIAQSPFYGAAFKRHESNRFSRIFLRQLIATDPWHVVIAAHRGADAGVIVTIPEFGTLWSSWIYALPEFRHSTLAVAMVRESIAHWDHGRFHKAACFTKPDNVGARKLFKRFGFREVALLKRHILGEDFILLEREFTKLAPGYDNGVNIGRLGRLRLRLTSPFRSALNAAIASNAR